MWVSVTIFWIQMEWWQKVGRFMQNCVLAKTLPGDTLVDIE